ncbi:hypothetical protein IJ531_04730, partial [bacterium]|nr:hypothetical protein [bacterium]
AGKLVSKVFKKATFNEAEHAQKLADKLAKYSFNNLDKAAKNIGAPDTKFVKAVGKRVGVFVADNEKAKEATKFITEKMGINSKSSIPLSILAGVFGWKFGDGGGDILEAVLDNKQIEREYNKLFADNSAA